MNKCESNKNNRNILRSIFFNQQKKETNKRKECIVGRQSKSYKANTPIKKSNQDQRKHQRVQKTYPGPAEVQLLSCPPIRKKKKQTKESKCIDRETEQEL